MKIKRLVIENFKSIERIELIEPNPFTVFVGPNGSGKSNIFEALEFVNIAHNNSSVPSLFGGYRNFMRRQRTVNSFIVETELEEFFYKMEYSVSLTPLISAIPDFKLLDFKIDRSKLTEENEASPTFQQFFDNFSRIFIKNHNLVKLKFTGDDRLALDTDNLETVLKRILTNNTLRVEIFEWLELFVPGFKALEVDDRDELHWFEEFSPGYFTKDLISDGTYNILASLTAVYQSTDEPQFLCIEEPENGLNPKVVKELVNLCRYACEEFGHHIWLNTHSQSLVSQLTPDEIILVDKKEGATQVKQIKGMNLHDLPMDEAWLTNALGGGLPW